MLSLNKKQTMIVTICLLSLILLSSCTSLKLQQSKIEPFYLLEANSDLYISIPVSGNEDFVKKILQNFLVQTDNENGSISEKTENYFNSFINRTDRICIAYNFAEESLNKISSFQAIIQGNYPFYASNFLFTQKNGFYKIKEDGKNAQNNTHWYNKNANFQTALPNSKMIFVSSDDVGSIQQNLNNYQSNNFSDTSKLQRFSKNQITFLNNPNNVTMYLTEPSNLVPQLMGAKAIKLAIDNALVSFEPVYVFDDTNKVTSHVVGYNLTVTLDMTNTQAQSLGFILLTIAKTTNSFMVEKIDTKGLFINDYFIRIDEILKILK